MTIAVIILAVMLCIMVGFAARQMQDLRESDEKIEQQRAEIRDLLVSLEMVLNKLTPKE